MGRLTSRKENGEAYVQLYADPAYPARVVREQLEKEKKVIEKLAHYEDIEEQDRLIELPFKIGDKVYTNFSMQGWYMQKKKKRPYEAKIVFIGINGIDNIFNVELGEGKMLGFRFSDIGKNVFLTKEEAEEKLKEMRGAE